MTESEQVLRARDARAVMLARAVAEWQQLSAQRQYPRSLHEILFTALSHEYALGRRASKLERGR